MAEGIVRTEASPTSLDAAIGREEFGAVRVPTLDFAGGFS